MTLFHAVAWDIDGTLIDSEPLHQRSLVAASAALGADLSDLESEAFRGVHALDIWKALKPRFPAGSLFDTWIAAIEAYYVAHAGELEPNPGALEAMRELAARGVAQACVSNSGRTIVDANIKALGIGKMIAFSLSLDDVSSGKPDPEPFREAARRLGADPQATVAVEDSAIALQTIAGYDALDPASVDIPIPNYLDALDRGVDGLRIGLPRHFFAKTEDVSAEVVAAIDRAAERLAKLGAVVEEITLPDYDLFNACGRIIMYTEAFAIHEQDYQRRPLDFGHWSAHKLEQLTCNEVNHGEAVAIGVALDTRYSILSGHLPAGEDDGRGPPARWGHDGRIPGPLRSRPAARLTPPPSVLS